jgi:hypothetical protein
MFQGVSLTPEQLSKGPVTDASISVDPAPIPTSTPHSQSDVAGLSEQSTRVSVSDMASAFTRFYKHDGDQITINALLGEHMQALVGLDSPHNVEELTSSIRHTPLRSGRRWLASGNKDPASSLNSVHAGMVILPPLRTRL